MCQSVLVVLLEQNPIQREGLVSVLRNGGFASCAVCVTLEDLYNFEPSTPAKLIFLVDFTHAYTSLNVVVTSLHSRFPGCAVIVLAEKCSNPVFLEALKSEADGLFFKQMECEVLVKSLELVLLGERVFPVSLLTHLCETTTTDDPESDTEEVRARLALLSPRERQVLLCLEAGDPNKVIARTCGITESTVKVHVKAILRKILAKNRTQAAVWARRTGLHQSCVSAVGGVGPHSALLHHEPAVSRHADLTSEHG